VIIALIKPQFECGKKALNKGGILKDKKLRDQVVEDIINFARTLNCAVLGLTEAPIKKDKNIEYLLYLKCNNKIS
jgi:23S rRNA (cytidine1920-2'-O)/16S rRNA (cytidine1409-2'-O)-methyltransferase